MALNKSTLGKHVEKQLEKTATDLVRKGINKIVSEYRARRVWSVSIDASDDFYYDVMDWLVAKDPAANSPRRQVAVRTGMAYENGGNRKQFLRVAFDGEFANSIEVDGHCISVALQENDGSSGSGEGQNQMRVIKPPKLIFTAQSEAGRQAIIDVMNDLHARKFTKDKKPGLMVLTKWNDWTKRSDVPARTMESVIVRGNAVEDLRADLLEFQSREAEYNRRGIPYHRAYLLTGPPGTGKTSSVKAIANALGMDLWYAQISQISKDSSLVDMLSDIRGGGILLLEDIDSFAAALDREDDGPATSKSDVTTSGLLNALDGVTTPHGLITIMTTNHPEMLDPALMRPGRVDRIFEFLNPDSDTIRRHFEFFYGQSPVHMGEFPEGFSSAAVSEIFKQNMDSPMDAEKILLNGL